LDGCRQNFMECWRGRQFPGWTLLCCRRAVRRLSERVPQVVLASPLLQAVRPLSATRQSKKPGVGQPHRPGGLLVPRRHADQHLAVACHPSSPTDYFRDVLYGFPAQRPRIEELFIAVVSLCVIPAPTFSTFSLISIYCTLSFMSPPLPDVSCHYFVYCMCFARECGQLLNRISQPVNQWAAQIATKPTYIMCSLLSNSRKINNAHESGIFLLKKFHRCRFDAIISV